MNFYRKKEEVYILGRIRARVEEDDPTENTVLVKEKGNLSPPRYIPRESLSRVYNKRFMEEQYDVCPFCDGKGEYYTDEVDKSGQLVGVETVGPITCRCQQNKHESTK